jgi:hypothetical protein
MKPYFYLIAAACIIISCSEPTSTIDPYSPILSIRFNDAEPLEISELTDSIGFIPIENTPKAYFTDIGKLSAKNGLLYIMETFAQKQGLFIFDEEGNFIRTVGEIGEGPGKMQNPTDFEILEDGKILFLDRGLRRVFYFNSEGEFEKTANLEFAATSFSRMASGDWFFSTNASDSLSYKLIITGEDFKPKAHHFTYRRDEKSIVLSLGHFEALEKETLFHKPINDTLYIFSGTGELKQRIGLDYGKETPPQEALDDFQKMQPFYNNVRYNYMFSRPVITEHYLVGLYTSTFSDGKVWLFDRKSGKLFDKLLTMENYTFKNIYRPLYSWKKNGVLSHMQPELLDKEINPEEIPEEIQEHLSDEGHVLIVHYLRANSE